MESPQVDDDICILKHETACVAESPVAMCSGDESVASHFALVTAYEDIKKRLRDTEKENTVLRKRVKQLEDKKKERAESEKILTEQLQTKELEVLQLRSEMETSQVMKSLNETQDYWHVNREGSEVQIHTLQDEVQRLRLENSHLHTLCTRRQDVSESSVKNDEIQKGAPPYCSYSRPAVMSVYEDVRSEVFRLHTLVRNQSELMKKLRNRPVLKRAASSALPVQCLDDVEKNHSPVRAPIPRPPSAPPLHVAPPPGTSYAENWKEAWPLNRPSPLGSPAGPPVPPQHAASSLDDGSWSIPAHPSPDHPLFWQPY
ncbi:5-azacytidine-induced protein 2 isoform X7 [Ictalurus punctatus]|uniref:5-azacytidine-induced protein 2 isoform X7 n=1 Tax=Ictalurus punctatus TaxID=7998 RepID=A0A9F7R8F6_ICTPU|nr:5-azacytidine-induced protein 2 isoform X7 [Ictalurus punctatus]